MATKIRDIMGYSSNYEKHITVYINDYIEQIKVLFREHMESLPIDHRPSASGDIGELCDRWNSNIRLDQTSSIKYYKVITLNRLMRQPIVHSFILKRDDDKFYYGDILLPDFYRDPFRIKSYGNIFTGYNLSWCKPLDVD